MAAVDAELVENRAILLAQLAIECYDAEDMISSYKTYTEWEEPKRKTLKILSRRKKVLEIYLENFIFIFIVH